MVDSFIILLLHGGSLCPFFVTFSTSPLTHPGEVWSPHHLSTERAELQASTIHCLGGRDDEALSAESPARKATRQQGLIGLGVCLVQATGVAVETTTVTNIATKWFAAYLQ